MKYLLFLFLVGCSKIYTVTPFYGDKELFGCAEESGGSFQRDYLYLDKDLNKVNEFCELRRKK